MNTTTLPSAPTGWRDKARMLRVFLRRAWTLAKPYFNHRDHKWYARSMLVAIVALNLGSVYMLVLINEWNRLFTTRCKRATPTCFGSSSGALPCWPWAT